MVWKPKVSVQRVSIGSIGGRIDMKSILNIYVLSLCCVHSFFQIAWSNLKHGAKWYACWPTPRQVWVVSLVECGLSDQQDLILARCGEDGDDLDLADHRFDKPYYSVVARYLKAKDKWVYYPLPWFSFKYRAACSVHKDYKMLNEGAGQ